jgi:hypothetical protein
MATTVTMTQGTAADAFVFTGGNVAANDTVVIGNITYTFVATPAVAYDVDVGADLDTSITNLSLAINRTGTPGATTYHTATVANPYFTATADLTNDAIDLTARGAGSWCNGIYLTATHPGANTITAGGTTFAAISGGTDGVGVLDDFIVDILAKNQVNAEVQYELKKMTDAAD